MQSIFKSTQDLTSGKKFLLSQLAALKMQGIREEREDFSQNKPRLDVSRL